MDHEKLAKSHGICDSVMKFYQFCPKFVLNLYFFGHHKEIKQPFRKSVFSDVSRKTSQIENRGETWSWKIKKLLSLWEPCVIVSVST